MKSLKQSVCDNLSNNNFKFTLYHIRLFDIMVVAKELKKDYDIDLDITTSFLEIPSNWFNGSKQKEFTHCTFNFEKKQ